MDANGVNLKTGTMSRAAGQITIGAVEDPSLAFTFFNTSYSAYKGTPLDGSHQAISCDNDLFPTCPTEFTLGYERCKEGETHCLVAVDADVGIVRVYRKDGSIWEFNASVASGNGLSKLTKRNGETLTYTTAGDTKIITSSAGYQLRGYTNGTGVRSWQMVNLATDFCGNVAGPCQNTSVNWPTVAIVNSPSSTNGYSATDALNRTWSATTAVANSSTVNRTLTTPGGKVFSFTEKIMGSSPSFPGRPVITQSSGPTGTTNYYYTFDSIDPRGTFIEARGEGPDGRINKVTGARNSSTYGVVDPIQRKTNYTFHTYYDQYSASYHDLIVGRVDLPGGGSVESKIDSYLNVTKVITTPSSTEYGELPLESVAHYDCSNYIVCDQPQYTIDPGDGRTDYTYDTSVFGHGGVTKKLSPPDANGIRQETRYTWAALQAVYKTGPGPAVPSGSPIWKIVETSTCTTGAGSSCVGTNAEVRTLITYNGNLLPVTETIKSGDGTILSTTTKTYDAIGNVIGVDGPLPGSADTWTYFFDAMRQKVGEIGPTPDDSSTARPAVRYTYNPEGQLTLVETGYAGDKTASALANMTVLQRQSTSYDPAGRKIREEAIAGGQVYGVTQTSYDSASRPFCTAVRMNMSPAVLAALPVSACDPGPVGAYGPDRITRNVYDDAGQLLQIRKAVGTAYEQAYATYSYTPHGKQEYVVDANGNKARLIYDGFDRQIRWQFPSIATPPTNFDSSTQFSALTTSGEPSPGDREEYRYDANGNRTWLRKRDGAILEYRYDALNRMIHKRIPNSTGAAPATVTANCHGNTPFSIASDSNDICYDYDLRGLQTSARFGWEAGPGVSNAYDGLGRITSTTTNMGVNRTLDFLYDAAGNRTRVTHPGGTYFAYGYDRLNRLLNVLENGGFARVSAVWGPQGRRESETRGAVLTTYGYDPQGRLKSINDELAGAAYDVKWTIGDEIASGYNPANQVVSMTRSNDAYRVEHKNSALTFDPANGLNQYTVARSAGYTPTSYGYDANGNLISEGGITYAYDAENRLISTSRGANLVYDPLGRLYETSFGSNGVTQFLYDGDQLTAEFDSSGIMLRRYVHGPGEDDPLLWYEGSGLADRRSIQTDHQGSVVSIADSGGNAIEVNSYDSYGVPTARNMGRFQFTGQAWIPELGMYNYKARIYSPMLGRFMQIDPIGYQDQMNLYAYAANDPVNRIDPKGKDSHLICRPVAKAGQHCFIVVTASDGKVRGWFSYGPQNDEGNPGKLVSVSGDLTSETMINDRRAFDNMSSKDNEHFVLNQRGIKDDDVLKAGRKVDGMLGTADKPGKTEYWFWPGGTKGFANSNSAAARVMEEAQAGSSEDVNFNRLFTPGWDHPDLVGTSVDRPQKKCILSVAFFCPQ